MAARPDSARRLEEAIGSPPLGIVVLGPIMAFQTIGYVLLGAVEWPASAVVGAGWIVFGCLHLVGAYALLTGRRWGWPYGLVLFGLDLVVVGLKPYAPAPDLRLVAFFAVVVGYLLTQRAYFRPSPEPG